MTRFSPASSEISTPLALVPATTNTLREPKKVEERSDFLARQIRALHVELEALPIMVGVADQKQPDLIATFRGDPIENLQNLLFSLCPPVNVVDGLAKLVAEKSGGVLLPSQQSSPRTRAIHPVR